MMSRLPAAGPRPQSTGTPAQAPRAPALVQLIAILTLALSTLIAATAVSIGLARADVVGCVVNPEEGPVAGKIVAGETR
jgi:hypothetical protein